MMGSNYASDPHDIMVPVEDFEMGVTKIYTSTGISHDHDITLTDADFAALKNGETVKKYVCLQNPSFTDHEFVFSCADPNISQPLKARSELRATVLADRASPKSGRTAFA